MRKYLAWAAMTALFCVQFAQAQKVQQLDQTPASKELMDQFDALVDESASVRKEVQKTAEKTKNAVSAAASRAAQSAPGANAAGKRKDPSRRDQGNRPAVKQATLPAGGSNVPSIEVHSTPTAPLSE